MVHSVQFCLRKLFVKFQRLIKLKLLKSCLVIMMVIVDVLPEMFVSYSMINTYIRLSSLSLYHLCVMQVWRQRPLTVKSSMFEQSLIVSTVISHVLTFCLYH